MPARPDKFVFDAQGVPLVAYIPEHKDRVPVPEVDNEDSELYGEEQHYCLVDWQSQPHKLYGTKDPDQIEVLAKFAADICRKWNADAKAVGHEYAYLVWTGSSFHPCYRRRATLEEIVQLKADARVELARQKIALNMEASRLAGARRLLKNELEEEE